MDSSGLLLMTNDGELANRLTHPRYEMHKIYELTVAGALGEEDVKRLESGLFLPDRRAGVATRTAASRLSLVKRDGANTKLRMELREGRNRQIRRMFADLGHKVKKLRRVQMGPLKLKGIAVGQWRSLSSAELTVLRRAAFHRSGRDMAIPIVRRRSVSGA
jgi:23S rRNA pseudouridine2605 synthase